MSGMKSPQGGLTRRSFLKTTGAVGALGLAGAVGMTTAVDWLSPAEAVAEPEEKAIGTFHLRHCQCHCHLKCTVRDGRLVMVEPNDWQDKNKQTVCLKGISEVQHIYSLDRIQVPLKRVGERGEGKFVQITWDEALDEIVSSYNKCIETHGPGTAMIKPAVDGMQVNAGKIYRAQNNPRQGIDRGYGNGYSPAIGESGLQGASSNAIQDWKNAKTILNVGCNSLETCMVTAPYFFEAKEAGAEIITIDPNYSTTAAKSSRWIPIQPGTDAALYLGMISEILDKGWYEKEYLEQHTCMPYLIKVSDGAFVRKNPVQDAKEKGDANPFMVIDSATGAVVPYNTEGVTPLLDGTATVGGEECRTVFSRLLEHQKQYPISWAAEKTGIAEETLLEITEKYACNGPSILSFGFGGGEKFVNNDIAGHASVLLATLVGSFGTGIPGRGAGAYVNSHQKIFGAANLPGWPLPKELKTANPPADCADVRDEFSNVHWLLMGAPISQFFGNQGRTEEWLRSLDFVAVQEVYHTTDCDWADIVLPVSSHFETEGKVGMLRPFRGAALLQQQVLEPMFESHSDFWIECEVAKRFGYGDAMPKDFEELVRYQLDNATDKQLEGITLEKLIENNGLMPLANQPEIHRLYEGYKFNTTSGRIDVYYDTRLAFDQALPTWEEPNEASPENPAIEKYPLIFMQRRSKYRVHGMFSDATWLQELVRPDLEINPVDAKARGLETGDVVEVFNDRGSFKCKCLLTDAVRPGSVVIMEGTWAKYLEGGNIQNVTNDYVTPRWKVLPSGRVTGFNDTLVAIKKA